MDESKGTNNRLKILGLIDKAFANIVQLGIGVSCLKCTGTFSFNKNIFVDFDIILSYTTNVTLETGNKKFHQRYS